MKVLVTGSRRWEDEKTIHDALVLIGATEVAQGGAVGADCLAWRAAQVLGLPCKTFNADWKTYGKRAGMIRNLEMLEQFKPDVVLAFWDGESRGTLHMITKAREAGFHTIVYRLMAGRAVFIDYPATSTERPPFCI